MTGCVSINNNHLNILRQDSDENHNITETLNYSKKEVFDAALSAIQSKSNEIIRNFDFSKGEIFAQSNLGWFGVTVLMAPFAGNISELGIFIEGNNPTSIRIVQSNAGTANEDYKNSILKEIKLILAKGNK